MVESHTPARHQRSVGVTDSRRNSAANHSVICCTLRLLKSTKSPVFEQFSDFLKAHNPSLSKCCLLCPIFLVPPKKQRRKRVRKEAAMVLSIMPLSLRE